MNGDADLPQRSSSPLKRRAATMDPETEVVVSKDGETTATVVPVADVHMESPKAAPTLPRAMSVDAPDPAESGETGSSPQPPPLVEQVKTIETLLRAFEESPVQEGDKVYVVSRRWVERALALREGSKHSKMELDETPLGPVDNSDIIEEVIPEPSGANFIRLRPGTGQEELALFPEDAWKLVMEWYGIKEGQEPIVRTAINTALDAQAPTDIIYELHPPVFRVHRLWSNISPLPIEQSLKARNPPAIVVSRSRKYRAQSFVRDLKNLTDIPIQRKIRIFTISEPMPAGTPVASCSALTPPDSPRQSPDPSKSPSSWSTMLLDISSYTAVPSENRVRVALEDQTANENYNGNATLQVFSLVTDQTLVLDEAIDKSAFVSTFTAARARSAVETFPTRSTAGPSKPPSSSRGSPIPEGPMTRGRAQRGYGRSAGAVGLHNLGNTCYMNSALQCVRSVEELTKYFLTDVYCEEINKTNPLGYNGKVAMAYGSLLKEIYEEGRGSVSPRDFKNTVGRCRSAFAGWGQQDSQEFLGFLLDALQEDLSRIKNKPYIEKPDSTDDMVNDPEAIREMADKVWDITRKRDDSVIADLFTGLYKSTLKCPECGKISITFDPFNNLTLPLPVENLWTHSVKFFPLNDVPVQIEVELPKHSSIETLKQFLSIRTGVPIERMIGAEEFKDRFFKIYDNNADISEDISTSDVATFHELEAVPTNWPCKGARKVLSMLDVDTPRTSGEWDDPMYDTMVIPVLHRRPQTSGRGAEGTSPPHFITLTRQEASNYDIIRRKVLERVSTFSTWYKFYADDEEEDDDVTDGTADVDPSSTSTPTSDADADTSRSGKRVSNSIAGEDDMVDTTMMDASSNKSEGPPPPLPHQPQILRHFNRRRPAFIRPDRFLDPELQSLFELSYFANTGDGTVPTGWSNVDNHRIFPKLTDRILPELSVRDEDEPSPESWNSAGSANEDSSNDEAPPAVASSETRMVDESSESDVPHGARGLARQNNRHFQKGSGGRKKFKNHKTYGKKGNKRREKQMRGKQPQRMAAVEPQPMPPAIADGGPLIRLYEGLIVDWSEEAWEVVFSGIHRDQSGPLGARTFVDLEVLKDPALKISQRRRASRRSRGITLEECLDEFERAEVLSEQDMWYCPRCKEHRRASKKFDLWKTPDYLVAHLKRFSSSGWRRDKLDVLVEFPIEGLDLTSRVIEKDDGKQEIYDLIAVDDHYGGLGGGHYTAYAKNFVDGRWYNYNDTSVSPVSDPSTMVTSAAYLLFYRRRTSEQRGGHRFGQIIDKFNSTSNSEEASGESGSEGPSRRGGTRLQGGAQDATMRSLASSGELPDYEAATHGETIRNSIENENENENETALQAPNDRMLAAGKSLDMTQSWSFNGLEGSGAEGSTAADFASDDAQFDSSGDERGGSGIGSGSGSGDGGGGFLETDTQMTSAEDGCLDSRVPSSPASNSNSNSMRDNNSISGGGKAWREVEDVEGIMSIPAAVDGAESDEEENRVAEIHLDSDAPSKTSGGGMV